MSYSPILIRFTRNTNDQTQDDVIRITPSLIKTVDESWMTEYNVLFTPANCQDTSSTLRMNAQLPARLLETYLKSLLKMVQHDAEPYIRIQVDMPLVPSVMFNPKDLYLVQSSILDNLCVLLHDWPAANRSVEYKKRRHIFFDENGDPIEPRRN